jgi:tetratricopeptide (TPR) repeat protein
MAMKRLTVFISALCLLSWCALPLRAADTDAQKSTEEKKDLLDRLERANALFSEDKIEAAVGIYKAVLAEKPMPPTWGKVTFNLGIALRRLSKLDEAIRTFETIFPSEVDDREAGGHLMEEFRNYRYRACLQISACYEAKGDMARALTFALSARDKHKYQAHCGTCAKNARERLEARITELKKKK